MLATPIEVKKAYKEGTHKKNYRFVVLNDDGTEDFTIDNDTLVAESVNIDERMATGSELKFGLCEGSSLEFQYFDHPNINGRTVQAFIDIYYDDVNTYSTPMGFFTVKECPRQFSTGIYKATAYNKLQSDYLDAKANTLIQTSFTSDKSMIVAYITSLLLGDYQVIENYSDIGTLIPPGTGGGSYDIIQTGIDTTGTLALYLPQYGVNSPLNSYRYSTGPLYLGFHARQLYFYKEISSVDQKIFMFFKKGAFISFERAFYNFLKKSLDDAQITDGNGNPLSGQVILDHICANQNFATICGIRSAKKINGQYKYYSTIQWEYEEANGLTHKVSGNANDGLADLQTGALMRLPYDYGLLASGTPTLMRGVSFDGQNHGSYGVLMAYGTYQYYTDSLQTLSETQNAPLLTFNNNIYPTSEDIISEYWGACLMSDLGIGATSVTLSSMPEFTLRDLQSAVYEAQCQYGQLDRQTDLFSGVELNGGGLYPAETLYPANNLYPNSNTGGQGIHPYPSEYSQLWTDTMGEQSFRYLIITYKTLDENNQEVDAVLQRTVNADGTTDYNMSDNWLFRNLVWTAADVGDYADAMVLKMQNIRWFPFEMWAAGLPYVETGDAIEITDRDGNTHNSYILQRQLQGIQNLQDTYVNGELDIF